MKRIKIKLAPIHSRDDAEAVMNDLASDVNKRRKFLADRDAEILVINRKYESTLAAFDTAIHNSTESLRAWAETNPDQFPKGRKSIEFVSGILGFRTGTPKLALLSRRWTWEKVLEKLRDLAPDFIRSKEEVDKDAIIAARRDREPAEDRLPAETLAAWGVVVTQDESFFIEPKLADMDARQVASPARTSEAA